MRCRRSERARLAQEAAVGSKDGSSASRARRTPQATPGGNTDGNSVASRERLDFLRGTRARAAGAVAGRRRSCTLQRARGCDRPAAVRSDGSHEVRSAYARESVRTERRHRGRYLTAATDGERVLSGRG